MRHVVGDNVPNLQAGSTPAARLPRPKTALDADPPLAVSLPVVSQPDPAREGHRLMAAKEDEEGGKKKGGGWIKTVLGHGGRHVVRRGGDVLHRLAGQRRQAGQAGAQLPRPARRLHRHTSRTFRPATPAGGTSATAPSWCP